MGCSVLFDGFVFVDGVFCVGEVVGCEVMGIAFHTGPLP